MNIKTREEREIDFLICLEKITRETGIFISGCGCCGSPSLEQMTEEQNDPLAGYGRGGQDEVAWIYPKDEYAWELYKQSIVK